MQVTPPNAPQPPSEQGGHAEQAIKMIQEGFMQLQKMMQAAQGQLDPQDIKLFQAAVQATDNFIQAITGGGEPAPQKSPGGPMPANANAGAKPMPQG